MQASFQLSTFSLKYDPYEYESKFIKAARINDLKRAHFIHDEFFPSFFIFLNFFNGVTYWP